MNLTCHCPQISIFASDTNNAKMPKTMFLVIELFSMLWALNLQNLFHTFIMALLQNTGYKYKQLHSSPIKYRILVLSLKYFTFFNSICQKHPNTCVLHIAFHFPTTRLRQCVFERGQVMPPAWMDIIKPYFDLNDLISMQILDHVQLNILFVLLGFCKL